ncbi:hypothetical protein KIPB_002932, partial [Kipferlia bialata]|eukprot:g2932.t1
MPCASSGVACSEPRVSEPVCSEGGAVGAESPASLNEPTSTKGIEERPKGERERDGEVKTAAGGERDGKRKMTQAEIEAERDRELENAQRGAEDIQWKIFVGGLPFVTTDDELNALFSQYGEVAEAVIVRDTDHETQEQKSKGFGFVRFLDP